MEHTCCFGQRSSNFGGRRRDRQRTFPAGAPWSATKMQHGRPCARRRQTGDASSQLRFSHAGEGRARGQERACSRLPLPLSLGRDVDDLLQDRHSLGFTLPARVDSPCALTTSAQPQTTRISPWSVRGRAGARGNTTARTRWGIGCARPHRARLQAHGHEPYSPVAHFFQCVIAKFVCVSREFKFSFLLTKIDYGTRT